MVRLTRIYTKTGDKGTTALGSGRRVSKDHPRIEACGDVDELNAALGLAVASAPEAQTADLLRGVRFGVERVDVRDPAGHPEQDHRLGERRA